MTTFLLLHGAWGESWQWRKVAALLRNRGHDVFTPTFTGLGERGHLMSPEINLDTHIKDIEGVITYEQLDDFVLVAHSYAGMVATAIADAEPKRLRALIYVDAALPKDGEAMLDIVSAERRQTVIGLAEEHGDGYRVPETLVLETGIDDAAERQEFLARMCPHPLAALLQPVRPTGDWTRAARKAYVFAALNDSHRFREYRDWAASQPDWIAEALQSQNFPWSPCRARRRSC